MSRPLLVLAESVGVPEAGEAVRSHPLELDQVAARLLEAATDDTLPRLVPVLQCRERSSLLLLDEVFVIEGDEGRGLERAQYNAL